MSEPATNLQIRVHEANGSVATFIQSDPMMAKAILEGFEPTQIFNQAALVLADADSHTTFPVANVTRVELCGGADTQITFPVGCVEAFELTPAQFQTLVRNPMMSEQWRHPNSHDNSVVVFLEVIMAGGQPVLLTMDVKVDATPRFEELQEYLLGRPGLCFRMQNGGVAVLNMANLARLTFFPGSVDVPSRGWAAHLSQAAIVDNGEPRGGKALKIGARGQGTALKMG